jgi:hypothetical protein
VVGQEEKAINQLRIVAKINGKNFQAGFFYLYKKNLQIVQYMLWSGIFGSLVFSRGNLYVPYTRILPQKPSTGFQHVPKCNLKIGVEHNKLIHLSSLANQIQTLFVHVVDYSYIAIVKGIMTGLQLNLVSEILWSANKCFCKLT